MMTTTNARMIASVPAPGSMEPWNVVTDPARPAKKAAITKTPVKRSRTFTPERLSSSGSETAARIIRPSPVL